MKTLDAHSLHVGIHELLRKLSDVKTQMDQVQRAVQEIASLEDSLMGKGGSAIRSFFQECHEPFLQVYSSFTAEYEAVLRNITNALQSLDSAHNALISQSFVENDVKNGLKKAKTVTVELTNEANDTMERVSDIVSLPRLSDADFLFETDQAKQHADRTLDRLIDFDVSQVNALETIEEQVLTMKQYIQTIEQLFQGGRLSVTGYEPGLLWGKKEPEVNVDDKCTDNSKIDWKALKLFGENSNVTLDATAPFSSIGNSVGTLSEFGGLTQTAYNTKVKGFEIKRDKNTFKVKNGLVENIKGKSYHENWIESQVKRGHIPEIANKVRPGTVAANTMKSKLGWVSIGITTTENMKENIENGESKARIIGDASADVTLGVANFGTSALFVSAVVASGGSVLVAAGVGFLISSGVTYLLEGVKTGKEQKTYSEKIKDGIQVGIESVAEFFGKN